MLVEPLTKLRVNPVDDGSTGLMLVGQCRFKPE